MAIPEEKLTALKREHGTIYVLDRDGQDFAFRPIKSVEYRAYHMAVATDRANIFDASEVVAKACYVYPDAAALNAVLESHPGLIPDLGGEVMLAGKMGAETRAKKA